MNAGTWGTNAFGYTNIDMLLDDVSKQMASSNLSRFPISRVSTSQKPTGTMRVVKPTSASNSPRGAAGLGRRRTVMNDGAIRRKLEMLDPNVLAAAEEYGNSEGLQYSVKPARPVSWHPTSHLVPQPLFQSTYQVPTTIPEPQYQYFDYQSTTSTYSECTPMSEFSPTSMPFAGYEQSTFSYPSSEAFFPIEAQYQPEQTFVPEPPSQNLPQQNSSNSDPTMYSHFDWNAIPVDAFENTNTSPPTPEDFLPIQHPDPVLPAEESIPYHPLSEPDSDGEELIGMGLYDGPDTSKPSDDPLDNYRALMMSSLMGTTHARVEPTGKGLKLEETWEPPPASDDGEDGDDEADQDCDDEDGEAEESTEDDTNQTYLAEPSPSVKEEPISHTTSTSYMPMPVDVSFGAVPYQATNWL